MRYEHKWLEERTLIALSELISLVITRQGLERALVKQGIYASLDPFRDDEGEYAHLNKTEFILKTLRGTASKSNPEPMMKYLKLTYDLLDERAKEKFRHLLSADQYFVDDEGYFRSLAGEVADLPTQETLLQRKMSTYGLDVAWQHLQSSYDNYINGDNPAANAMTRSCFEEVLNQIAQKLEVKTGKPIFGGRQPGTIRQYLREVGFLDDDEQRLLNAFYGYSSGEGSHPGLSTRADANMRRFMLVGLVTLLIEKAEAESLFS